MDGLIKNTFLPKEENKSYPFTKNLSQIEYLNF